MPGPWEAYQQPAAPAPQRLPAPAPAPAPRPVTRLPAPTVRIDPAEAERLRLAQEAAVRAQESSARDAATTAATLGRFEADMADRERRLAAGPAADAAESERKGGGFYRRALNSESAYTRLDFDPATPGVQATPPRSYVGQVLANNAPDVLNSLPSGIGNSPQRQQADQAQREFIAAVLRYDSGAAVPEPEYESNARIYFPMPGDSAEVIAQKGRARRAAIEGLALSAGRLRGEVERLAAADMAADARPDDNLPGGPIEMAAVNQGLEDDPRAGARLTRGQERAYLAFLRTLPQDAPVEQNAAAIDAWTRQNWGGMTLGNTAVIADAISRGQVPDTFDYGNVDENRTAEMDAELARRASVEQQGSQTLADISSGIGEVLDPLISGRTLGLSDEAAGIAGGLAGAFDGRGVIQGYQNERDLARREEELRRERQGGLGTALEFTGGFLAGRPGALIGPQRIPGAGQLAREGAQAGALAGFGYGEGVQSAPNALLGAAVGGAIGYGAGRFINRAGGNPPPPSGPTVAQAAQSQGVDLLPADVGGPTTRLSTAALAQLPGSAAVVRNAAQRSRDQLGNAVERVAAATGTATTTDVAGEAVRRAGQAVIDRSRTVGRQLYERAERMAGGVRIAPQQAVATIDSEIARLSETPEINAPLIAELQRFRQSLTNNRFISVSGLRDARTIAGRAARTEALRATDAQRVMGNVMSSLADDINVGLRQAGRGNAAAAFQRADDLWRQRIEYIDQTLEPLIGRNRSGEQIVGAIESYTRERGNAAQLRRVLRAMDPQELGDLQATLVSRIGRARNSQQDDVGEAFSPETFLTRWNEMTPQAKNVLFQGELRRNLDQIATIANGMRGTNRFTNTSNTGLVVGTLATGSSTAAGLPVLALSLGSQYLGAKLLTSPGFTQWLARAPRTGAIPGGYIRRLGQIAAREPTIARELQQFQAALEQGLSQSPSRAMAEGQPEQDGRQIPPQ